MVHGAEHLVVSAIEFVPVEGFRTATIGRIRFYNHDCGAVFLARIASRPRLENRENRFASLKKPLGALSRAYPLDCATSLMLCAGLSLPEDWNSMSGNCSTARRRDCAQVEWSKVKSLSPAETRR